MGTSEFASEDRRLLTELDQKLNRVLGQLDQLQAQQPGALSIEDFCATYGIGQTKVFELIAAGQIHSVKVGRRRLIPIASAQAWLTAQNQIGQAS